MDLLIWIDTDLIVHVNYLSDLYQATGKLHGSSPRTPTIQQFIWSDKILWKGRGKLKSQLDGHRQCVN